MRVIDCLNNDIKDLFEDSELKFTDYQLMIKNRNKRNFTPYWGGAFDVPNYLPSNRIQRFEGEILYVKRLIESAYLLKEPRPEYSFVNSLNPSLYELIKQKKLIPKNVLSELTVDITEEINNYHKLIALQGYFGSSDTIFHGEPKKEKYLENYFDWLFMLEKDNILRKCNSNELELILNFKTIPELVEIASVVGIQMKINKKPEIIQILAGHSEIQKLGLHEYFFVLEDNFQIFKMWVRKEYLYYSIYEFLQEGINSADTTLMAIIQRTYTNDKNYKMTAKLINLFFRLRMNKSYTFQFFDSDKLTKIRNKIKKMPIYSAYLEEISDK